MIQKLVDAITKKKAPVVVGLDPMLDYIPDILKEDAFRQFGETLEGAADAVYRFNQELVDAVADLVPAVKPQIAMYEQFGVPGLMAYKKTVDLCREKGLIVVADIKRGDIGSTSGAYAAGHLGTVQVGENTFSPFDADMATVNPYLGSDGVKPFLDVCKACDKGVFVLVKTSNPSSGEFQDRSFGEETLYQAVAQQVNVWGEDLMEGEYSNVGAVVGATYPEMGRELRQRMPHAYILVPGYGAQGGKGKDLAGFFHKNGLGALVNSSRGIIAAWKQEKYAGLGCGEAARKATEDMLEDIREAVF